MKKPNGPIFGKKKKIPRISDGFSEISVGSKIKETFNNNYLVDLFASRIAAQRENGIADEPARIPMDGRRHDGNVSRKY